MSAHTSPGSQRIAGIRDVLLTLPDASPESDYAAYADQIDDLYGAIVAVRKESLYDLYTDVVPLLDHPDASIRQQSISTLGFLSQGSQARTDVLANRAAAMWVSDPDSLVRAVALRVWSQPYRDTADPAVLQRLAAVLYDEGESVFVRQEASNAILTTSGTAARGAGVNESEDHTAITLNVDWPQIESILSEAGAGTPPGHARTH